MIHFLLIVNTKKISDWLRKVNCCPYCTVQLQFFKDRWRSSKLISVWYFKESTKLRASMLKTYSRANVPCVLTCSRAHMPCVLRAHGQRALRTYMFTFQSVNILRPLFHTAIVNTWSPANMLCLLSK